MFVDWTARRDFFERQASAYLGRPVSIAGKATLRILPTPLVSFTDVSVGAAAAPDVEIERFLAEIDFASLLKGEVRVVRMRLERPRFHLDIAVFAGGPPKAPQALRKLAPDQVSLERVEIADGTALIEDSRNGRRWRSEAVEGVVEASSLLGPGKVDATLVFDDRPISLKVGFGKIGADRTVKVKTTVATPEYPATLSADGIVAWPADAPPTYAGLASVAGNQPKRGEARSRWADFEAKGAFKLSLAALSIDAAQISYGALERPLVLAGSGRLDLAEAPRFEATVTARQIDVDTALGGGAEHPVQADAGIGRLIGALPDLPRAPVPGALHLEVQGVALGGNIIQDVRADLATAEDSWKINGFGATLPGDTRVALDGVLRASRGQAFEGHGRIASKRPAALAEWWRGEAGRAGALDRFDLAADLALAPDDQRLSDLVMKIGKGTVRGKIELRRFGASSGRFVKVDLDADRADLAQARALTELLLGKKAAPADIDHMTLSLRAETLVAGGAEAKSVAIDGVYESGSLDLQRLSVADLAGAAIEANGKLEDVSGTPKGRLEATVKAADLTGAAEFFTGLLPQNPVAAKIRQLAPGLSPAEVEISLQAGVDDPPLSLNLTGSFADTHLAIAAKGRGDLRYLNSLSGELSAHIDGEDTAKVLSQLGLTPVPFKAGPTRLDAELVGMLATSAKLDLKGAIAGIDIGYTAEVAVEKNRVAAVGEAKAETADLDPALLMAGAALPGLGEGHAAAAAGQLEISGGRVRMDLKDASFDGQPVAGSVEAGLRDRLRLSGRLDLDALSLPVLASLATGSVPAPEAHGWSAAAFAPPLPSDVALDLKLRSKTLDLGLPSPATSARLALALSGGKLDLNLAEADFAGGKIKGALSASMREGEAAMALSGSLAGAHLDSLVWRSGDLPAASGLLDASVEVAGHGRSLAGLVSTLSGNGSFAVSDGRFNTLNPDALHAVMQIAEGDDEPDENLARETFASTFGAGALGFGKAAGSFSIASGIVQAPTVSISSGGATVLAGARVDLNTLQLSSDWSVRTAESGAAQESRPSVRIAFKGPIGKPERRTDLGPLLDAMRSRFLQRQLDKLEELEKERERREQALRALAPRVAGGETPQPPETSAAGAAATAPPAGTSSAERPSETPAGGEPPAPDQTGSTESAAPTQVQKLIRRMAPALRDLMSGGATAVPHFDPLPGAPK